MKGSSDRSPRRGRLTPALLLCLVLSSLFLSSCGPPRVPVRPGEIPRGSYLTAQDERYGHEVLNQLTEKFPLERDDAVVDRTRDVVDRLTRAIGADENPWHVYVLRDPGFKNAAATRGNFVFVWTGLLNYIRDDDELAVILAHEIGHVLAGHTMPNPAEEARSMMSGVGGQVAREMIARQGGAYGAAAGLGGVLVTQALKAWLVNPEAQRKEYEADQIGLFIMADAGISPRRAVEFWERVQDDPDFGGGMPELLSTHPSSVNRTARLKELLPMAERRYEEERRPRRPERRRRRGADDDDFRVNR